MAVDNQRAAFRSWGITARHYPAPQGSQARGPARGRMLAWSVTVTSFIVVPHRRACHSGPTDSVAVLKSARGRRSSSKPRAPWSPRKEEAGPRVRRAHRRMCYWYEHGDDEEDKVPTSPEDRQARPASSPLSTAQLQHPGTSDCRPASPLSLEDGKPQQAARVVEECRAVAWCARRWRPSASRRGDFARRQRFCCALADMPDEERAAGTHLFPARRDLAVISRSGLRRAAPLKRVVVAHPALVLDRGNDAYGALRAPRDVASRGRRTPFGSTGKTISATCCCAMGATGDTQSVEVPSCSPNRSSRAPGFAGLPFRARHARWTIPAKRSPTTGASTRPTRGRYAPPMLRR